jgi:DNA-binding SARP family transcriptional activator
MRINVLGPIEISGGGRDGRLAGPGQRALLAALALDHGRVVGVGRLARIPPSRPPPAGRAGRPRSRFVN